MVVHHLLLDREHQILHAILLLLQIDVAQATVEEHLARVEFEEKAELGVVDHGVAAQIEQGIIEVGKGLFEVADEEVGDALLEVGDGEVLVEADGSLVALNLVQGASLSTDFRRLR